MNNEQKMKLTEETISSKHIYDGAIIKVIKDTVLLENGKQATREVVLHNGAVCVVAVTEDNMVYLVKQYRYPFKRIMTEVPAGKIDKDENPLDAAHRELEEEIGMKAQEMIYMGEFCPSCAFLTEVIHMYIAKGLTPSKQNLDEDEFLNIEKLPLSEVCNKILNGEIKDGKTIASILKAEKLL